MSSLSRKIQKNADNFIINEYFKNMTPEMYKEGINNAIKMTESRLIKQYNEEIKRMAEKYNESLREGALLAMDTLATEMIYELGNVLECYKEEPEYLDQKVEIVQNIYEAAMQSIADYASKKYKTDKHAQKEFKRKKKLIQKIFGMESNDGEKKSK
jgi:CheY-specific phosphatase CheX